MGVYGLSHLSGAQCPCLRSTCINIVPIPHETGEKYSESIALYVVQFLYIHDGMASITVRVPNELKRELEETGVKISEVTRRALENEVKRIREEKAREAARKLSELLSEVPDDEIIRAIRETRDQR